MQKNKDHYVAYFKRRCIQQEAQLSQRDRATAAWVSFGQK